MAELDAARATMLNNIPDKTGKPLAEWIARISASGLEKHGAILKLLKSEHGVTHGFANLIATEFRTGGKPPEADDLLAAQYKGDKGSLKSIYDQIVNAAEKLGDDVDVSPKKSYVSLRRKKQFAIVQPSTKTRVDLGLNLKGTPAKGRLEASGSFNAMVSHRVRLEDSAQIDTELKDWLKAAYEAAR